MKLFTALAIVTFVGFSMSLALPRPDDGDWQLWDDDENGTYGWDNGTYGWENGTYGWDNGTYGVVGRLDEDNEEILDVPEDSSVTGRKESPCFFPICL